MSQQSSQAPAYVTKLTPESETVDTMPHDSQPPGVDEEWEPQSLEEALLGE
tara:strand:+ start:468 stop:620 length:153 start_codon:yes stop_codon:yes gene_type:complete